jgi:UPF0042 nucleotide-binding protein
MAEARPPGTQEPIQVVIVTGLSGSGKSCVLKSLEDLGFFCVDNMPPRILPAFLRIIHRWMPEVRRVAVTVDIRERAFLQDFPRVYYALRRRPIRMEVLFLEADDSVLVRRFNETRRPHPLAFDRPVWEGIRDERLQLQPIRQLADRVIDTGALSVHQLRRFIFQTYGPPPATTPILQLISFGYRHGVPFQADLVWDVRFLPNPHFDPQLRARTGLDPEVRKFVLSSEEARRFLRMVHRMLRFLLPHYQAEAKHYVTIAIGCTGGRHRSVAIVEALAHAWRRRGWRVEVEHRDLDKPENVG